MNKKVIHFLIWLGALSAVIALCGWILAMTLNDLDAVLQAKSICLNFYMFAPLISVLIVEKCKLRQMASQYRLTFRGIDVGRFVIYLLGTIVLLQGLVYLFVYLLGNLAGIEAFGRIWGEPAFQMNWYWLLWGLTAGFAGGLFGELAWRGLMWNNLSWSDAKKNLLTGAIWGVWNIPIILLSGRSEPMMWIGMTILFCIVCSFFLSNALKDSRTILLPAFLQGVIIHRFAPLTIMDDNQLLTGTGGVLMIVVIVMLTLLFKIRTRGSV